MARPRPSWLRSSLTNLILYRLRPCPSPPSRGSLITEANTIIVKKYGKDKQLVVVNSNRLPDLQWLLVVLSTLDPNHIIFLKNWSKSRHSDPLAAMKVDYIMSRGPLHAMFQGLPPDLLANRKSLKHYGPNAQLISHA